MLAAFAALADPIRFDMVELLGRKGELCAGEVERALAISQPSASKHLRALREAGLVAVRSDAQRRFYRLEAAPLAALDGWLGSYRHFWSGRLDELGRHLDRES